MVDKNMSRGGFTKTEIIRAAHKLFVQQGYHGTSMRQIAKEASIALGGLYNHFESKAEVFRTVFNEYHPYHDILPAVLEAQGDSIEEYVRDIADRMFETLEGRPDFMKLMFIEVVEFNSVHASELFVQILPQELQLAERIGQTDRDRLRPIPLLLLIRIYFGMFFGYYLTEIIMAKKAPEQFLENAQEAFIDVYLHGILRETSSSEE
jgi:AcrR family transcriptional regulator